MKVWPKGKPDEAGEALVHDGSEARAKAIVAWCGPDHAGILDGSLYVWERYHVRVEGNLQQQQDQTAVDAGDVVVNPYRGNFLVFSAADFAAAWEHE